MMLLSSESMQSPAQSLVPLTVPTNSQPVGALGFTWTSDFPPTTGRFVSAGS
jgi:hypothetical protein